MDVYEAEMDEVNGEEDRKLAVAPQSEKFSAIILSVGLETLDGISLTFDSHLYLEMLPNGDIIQQSIRLQRMPDSF